LAESVLANAYYRYHIERDYEGARVLFEKMRRETPSSSEAPAALARIARRQSRWNDSIRLYEEAAKLNPRDPYLFLDRAWTFSMLRQHVATAQMIEGALALKPDDPEILVNKAKFLQMIGDLPAARAVIARFPARTENRQADDLRAVQLVWERRYDEAVRLIEALAPKRTVDSPADGLFWNNFLASVRSLAGDREGSRQAYLAARATLETLQRDQPKNAFIISAFAFNEAGLGNKEAALREAERAVALFPAAEDPVFGPAVEENLAAVEGLVGETDRAVARLERLLSTPYGAFPVTQASMRIDPVWDPLRSHPRFKALADGPEPKTVYK
jgi:tetratricopeptide (TPR) repeat protein